MKLTIVVAAALDHAIGKDNELLWKLPNDLKFLKNKTWGLPVLMGRKTWDSLKGIPLKGRPNLVLSRSAQQAEGAVFFTRFEEAMAWCGEHDYAECCLLGGAQLYQTFMPRVTTIFLTRVEAHFPEADAHFPEIDENAFYLHHSDAHPPDEKHKYAYRFEEWRRK